MKYHVLITTGFTADFGYRISPALSTVIVSFDTYEEAEACKNIINHEHDSIKGVQKSWRDAIMLTKERSE